MPEEQRSPPAGRNREEQKRLGAQAPITPPKAAPARKTEEKEKGGEAVLASPTSGEEARSKSPRSTVGTEEKEGSFSPDRGASSSRSRTPLARRPKGAKQRAKYEKKEENRVKFAEPLEQNKGSEKGKQRKGKGKGKKGAQKGKGKKGRFGQAKGPGRGGGKN